MLCCDGLVRSHLALFQFRKCDLIVVKIINLCKEVENKEEEERKTFYQFEKTVLCIHSSLCSEKEIKEGRNFSIEDRNYCHRAKKYDAESYAGNLAKISLSLSIFLISENFFSRRAREYNETHTLSSSFNLTHGKMLRRIFVCWKNSVHCSVHKREKI